MIPIRSNVVQMADSHGPTSRRISSLYQKRTIHMAASFLPTILVPIVGLVFPAITMAALFLYIERGQATTSDGQTGPWGQTAEDSQTEVV